jgi:hypothetical protein
LSYDRKAPVPLVLSAYSSRPPRRFTDLQIKRCRTFQPQPIEHRRKIEADPCTFDAGRWQRVMLLAGTIIEAWRAADRADQRHADLERALRVGAPEQWASASDRGAQGQAMQARGAKVEDVEVDVHEQAGATYLERAAVARVRDGVIDHYERIGVLWGRRLEALQDLARLYQRGRVAPGTGRSAGGRGHAEMSDEQARAWADYCQATDHLSPGVRTVVEDVARDRFPQALDTVDRLRRGSRELADHFRLLPDKVPERSA